MSETPARTIAYAYDAWGRQAAITDSAFAALPGDAGGGDGATTRYGYDGEGRLTSIQSPQGELYYGYDALGRKEAAWTGHADKQQSTTLTEYGYDPLGRLVTTTATRRFGQAVDVDPSAAGVQAETTRTVFATDGRIDYERLPTAGGGGGGGELTKDWSYDGQGRVASVRHFADLDGDGAWDDGSGVDPQEVLVSGFAYTHFADGSRSSETATDAAGRETTRSWGYDALNRLVSEAYDGFDGGGDDGVPDPLAYTDAFGFDLSGNRTLHVRDDRTPTTPGTPGSAGADATTAYRYDAGDRLVEEVRDEAVGRCQLLLNMRISNDPILQCHHAGMSVQAMADQSSPPSSPTITITGFGARAPLQRAIRRSVRRSRRLTYGGAAGCVCQSPR